MSLERVIALIDMDCFYVQCEQRLSPNLWSHPCAVAQYNNWKGGGLIAVNYEARSHGVQRGMRGDEAKRLCPNIHIFSVPEVRGKAELSRYREGSAHVFNAIIELINQMNPNIVVEKASIDEAFVDLTQEIDKRVAEVPPIDHLNDTKIEINGDNDLNQWLNELKDDSAFYANDIRLAMAAVVVKQIRNYILEKTQFKCSAGISHNKMLAKLVCALNKPNAQTILPKAGVEQLFKRIDINKVRSLGGKLGSQVKKLFGINTMYQLKCLQSNQLHKHFERKTVNWLTDLANGVDEEPVSNRQVSKSLGCGKNFPGKTALSTIEDIKYWVKQLCEELVERMTTDKETNKRAAKLITVGYRFTDKDHNSKSFPIETYCDANKLAEDILKQVFLKIKCEPIVNISISASKFVDDCDDPTNNTSKLDTYFTKVNKNDVIESDNGFHQFSKSKRFKSNENNKTIKDYLNTNRDSFKTEAQSDCLIVKESNETNVSTIKVVDHFDGTHICESVTNLSKRGFFYRKKLEMELEID